jgi:hypothetical protein
VHAFETDAALARLRDALQDIARAARELERAARDAAALAETLDSRGRSAVSAGGLDPRQAALLVAVTLRGGMMEADAFAALAARIEVSDLAVAELFAAPDPHLVRRARDGTCITERGLDAAASWRASLPEDLRNAATDL